MADYGIAALKAAQDAQDAEAALVLDAFKAFSDGFFEALAHYAIEAEQAGLRGVKRLKPRATHGSWAFADIMINHFPLVLVYSDEVLLLPSLNTLAARILGYNEPNGKGEPGFDFCILNMQGDYKCQFRVWSDRTKKLKLSSITGANVEGGRKMAELFIGMVNSFQFVWTEHPFLSGFLDTDTNSSAFGFIRS